MSTFERITFRGARQRHARTWLVEVLSESGEFLHCRRVNREGDANDARYTREGVLVENEHLIQKSAISKRVPLRLNQHYCELEEVDG